MTVREQTLLDRQRAIDLFSSIFVDHSTAEGCADAVEEAFIKSASFGKDCYEDEDKDGTQIEMRYDWIDQPNGEKQK